jgi:hypothetical protein
MMSTDLSDQIHELMECLRPVSVADIESAAPAQVTALQKAAYGLLTPRLGWPRLAAGAAAAAVAAMAVTLALTMSGSPSRTGGVTGPALATAYVVHRVESAVANDNQVMRETRSLDDPKSGGAGFWDGQPSSESVTWAYQGHNSIDTFGVRGQLQGTTGTGIVNGKPEGVQVDYVLHQWGLVSGMLHGAPVNACTSTGLLVAIGDPGTNWPLLIGRTLACGGFKMAGYAEIDGAKAVKMTGSRVNGGGTVTVTLFASPSTYLPVRITVYLAAPGLHGSLTSFDFKWLPPTRANRARTSVAVPCGYQQINETSGKPVRGEPSSACG